MWLLMSEDTEGDVAVVATEKVVIELDRRTKSATYQAGNTLLQTARLAGLQPPYSCQTGSCGTCIARVIQGGAPMLQRRTRRWQGGRGLGAHLPGAADQSHRSGDLRVES